MNKEFGDERYVFVGDLLYKAQRNGIPDKKGLEFHKVSELEDGFIIYIKPQDPSQPNPSYFIHKRYILNLPTAPSVKKKSK